MIEIREKENDCLGGLRFKFRFCPSVWCHFTLRRKGVQTFAKVHHPEVGLFTVVDGLTSSCVVVRSPKTRMVAVDLCSTPGRWVVSGCDGVGPGLARPSKTTVALFDSCNASKTQFSLTTELRPSDFLCLQLQVCAPCCKRALALALL